ncbi:MAG: hypothetical protein U7123_03000 [Potamolinea sp.]
MDVELSVEEISSYRQVLQGDIAAQKALATLEKHDGSFDNAFDELLVEKYGQPRGYGHSLREVTLKNLRQ